jgi:hypothetical protein
MSTREIVEWGIPGHRQCHGEEVEQAQPVSPYLQAAAHRAYDLYLRTYPLPQDGDYSVRRLLYRAAAGQGLVCTQLPMLVALVKAWAGRCSYCRGAGVIESLGDSRLEAHKCDTCAGTGVRHG